MKLNQLLISGFLIVASLVILSSVFLSLSVSKHFQDASIDRAKSITANFISTKANKELTKEDFTPNDFEKKEQIFNQFFEGIDTKEILRIKVWSSDATILYSNDKSIIGKRFPDNHEFLEAMKGEVEADIKEPEKRENIAEKGYEQLMEVYVPIELGSGDVAGVIETYTKLDFVNESIREHRANIWQLTILSSIITIAVTGLIFYYIRKTLIKPIAELTATLDEASKGRFNLDVTITKTVDEISVLAASLSRLIKTIKLALLKDKVKKK